MTAHFLGVSGSDIDRVLSILGVCGGIGFEQNYTRCSLIVGSVIRSKYEDIITEALRNKICTKIRQRFENNVDGIKIKHLIEVVQCGDSKNLP